MRSLGTPWPRRAGRSAPLPPEYRCVAARCRAPWAPRPAHPVDCSATRAAAGPWLLATMSRPCSLVRTASVQTERSLSLLRAQARWTAHRGILAFYSRTTAELTACVTSTARRGRGRLCPPSRLVPRRPASRSAADIVDRVRRTAKSVRGARSSIPTASVCLPALRWVASVGLRNVVDPPARGRVV